VAAAEVRIEQRSETPSAASTQINVGHVAAPAAATVVAVPPGGAVVTDGLVLAAEVELAV